jgi:hypothetical protein
MVDRPDRLEPTRRIGEEKQSGGPVPGQSFETYMEKAGEKPTAGKSPIQLSPFDLAQNQTMLAKGPTFDSLLTQVKVTHGLLGDINNNLQTKNLKLKPSQRHLLRSKLTTANSYLKGANTDLGIEAIPQPPTKGAGILGKFLDYVTEGQGNLAAAQQQLMTLNKKGDNVNPADFLAIQLKLSHAQQEIEYASIMLSKAVEDMRTLFNIQL